MLINSHIIQPISAHCNSSSFSIRWVWLYWAGFLLAQLAIYYVFATAGRDNEEYSRLFASIDESYLEPFWQAYHLATVTLGISNYIEPTLGMFILSILAASIFFSLAINGTRRPLSAMFIIVVVAAYQVSLVSGALRQGVSFFLFASFLLGMSERNLFLSAITHLSGVFYLLYSRYVIFYASIVGVIMISTGLSDSDFISLAINRYQGYLGAEDRLDATTVLLFSFLKVLTLLIFLYNYKYLNSCFSSRIVFFTILLTPAAQLLVYHLIPNPIITDRANLILDPFILVGISVLAKNLNIVNLTAIFVLTAPKLVARLYFAFF